MNDFEQLKLCAARFAWPRRNERTPSGKCTWAEWWQRKFGPETLDAYLAGYSAQAHKTVLHDGG